MQDGIPWSSDLLTLAQRFGPRIAITDGSARLTYATLSARAHGLARRLIAEGFKPGQPVLFTAVTPAIAMLLGGEPVGPRFIDWNFVSSSKERIDQAKADWKAGRMKLPDADDQEFIPLPETPAS